MKNPSKAQHQSVPDFFSPQVLEARRFYLDLSPPKTHGLSVVCGGVERSAPGYEICRTNFPFYSIEYVLCGRGTVKFKERTHLLGPGSLFSYGPSIEHNIISSPTEPLIKYFVDFSGTSALRLLRTCKLPPGQASHVFPSNELQGLFDELISSGLKASRGTGQICLGLLQCLSLKILDSCGPMEGVGTLSFSTYQKSRHYIQQHFLRLRTLKQIAEECHLDGAHLCRLFKRYDHQSPYRYLLRLKMNLAAESLQQPGALVKEVSEKVGFSDPFHFSRAFKNVFGLSPDSFRRLR